MSTCQNCGRTVPDGAARCPNCGVTDPLRERDQEFAEGRRRCHACGEPLRKGEKGCAFCGARRASAFETAGARPELRADKPFIAIFVAVLVPGLFAVPVILTVVMEARSTPTVDIAPSPYVASERPLPKPKVVTRVETRQPPYARKEITRALGSGSETHKIAADEMLVVFIEPDRWKRVFVRREAGAAVDVALYHADVWRQYTAIEEKNRSLDHQVHVMAGRRLVDHSRFEGQLYKGHAYYLVIRCSRDVSEPSASVLVFAERW